MTYVQCVYGTFRGVCWYMIFVWRNTWIYWRHMRCKSGIWKLMEGMRWYMMAIWFDKLIYDICMRGIYEFMGVYVDIWWVCDLVSRHMTYVWEVYGSLWGYILIYDRCMRKYRILYWGICCYMLIYDRYMRCTRGIWYSMGVYDDIGWLYCLISWYLSNVWDFYGSLLWYMLIHNGCMREYRIVYWGIFCFILIFDGYMMINDSYMVW